MRRSYWGMLAVGAKAALVTHVLFGALFAFLDHWSMVVVNVGSVLAYVLVIALLDGRRTGPALAVVSIEVVGHAIVATCLLGLDSGFQYYLLVMVPLVFVDPNRTTARRILAGGLLLAVYVALDTALHRLGPAQPTPTAVLGVVRIFNISVTFLLLARLAHTYAGMVEHAESRLRTMATTDPLTGALNRRSLIEAALQQVFEEKPFTIVMADVDHFKVFNDIHGHAHGDRVLVKIHRCLQASVRPDDLVARWGGEEFVLLLPLTGREVARVVTERARHAIERARFAAGDDTSRATMTFGVAHWKTGESAETTIARADGALYCGKAAGRNCVELAD